MEMYPNNTDAGRAVVPANTVKKDIQEEALPDAIIEGEVKKKKQTFGDKARSLLIKEDAKSVWSYVFGDILIPALKNTFVSMVQNGVDLWVNGSVSPRRVDRRDSRVTRTPYGDYYDSGNDQDYRGRRRAYAAPTYSYDEIEFDSKGDAEAVLMRLRQRIYDTGSVSIAYLYSLVRWNSDYTANQYGWINLDQANVIRTGNGYLLKLPRPVEL